MSLNTLKSNRMKQKNLFMKLVLVAVLFLSGTTAWGQTPVPMTTQLGLSYTENFADITNWTNAFAAGIGANRWSSVAVNATGTIPSATRVATATATFVTTTSGGVQRGTGNIILLATGGTDNTTSAAIDFLMNFTGVNAGTMSFDAATVFNSTGNRSGTLHVYATTDNVTWTELTGTNLPYVATNNVAGSAVISNIALPANFNSSATARLRFYVHNSPGIAGAAGSRPKISIDNVTVTAINPTASPVVTSNTATATVDVPFSYYISASNVPTAFTATSLPAGLNINTTTGQITGTPTTAAASLAIPMTASNANGSGSGTLTLTINPGSQAISFSALTAVTYGDAPFNLTATGGASTSPVTFTSSDPFVASVSGNTVTIVGAGTANITASQAGDANYNAATDVVRVLTVNQAPQTITFGPLSVKLTTDPSFVLTAIGGASGNTITYSSSNTSVATILGNMVTLVGAGSTIISASQAGNANYLPAVTVSQTQIVNLAGLISQSINFSSLPPLTYGVSPVTLTATGGASGNAVTYTSSNTNVISITGNVMTVVGTGSAIITASQAGDAAYEPALDVMQTQVVNPKELTIPGASAFNKVYDGSTTATLFNLTLSGVVSGDIVSVSGGGTFASPNVGTGISVSGNLILAGIDSFKYILTQPTGMTADITAAPQTIVFGALPAKTFTSAPFVLTASGGTVTNPVTFTSSNPLVATIAGNTVTIIGVGTTNITASLAADQNYDAAVDVIQPLIVTQATQFITFAALPNKIIGDPTFTLSATASSTLTVSYVSSNPSVASVSGNVVTIVGVGTTSITASQAGNTNFLAATDVAKTLTVTYPIIAAWDFFGQNTIATMAATTFNSNLVSTNNLNKVTRGDSAAASLGVNSFRTVGFRNNGISTSNADYFQTTLKAVPGRSLSLYSINANFAGTTSYAVAPGVSSQFAYSLDGTNFTLIGTPFVTVGQPVSSPVIDLTAISALQNIHESKTITIRYYATGQTATGGWGFTSATSGTNGLAFGGNLQLCVPVTNTSNVTVCASALPYTWGAQTITAGGTYTTTSINATGCDSIEVLNLTVNPCANSLLNLKCYIQGYYSTDISAMVPVLANQSENSTPTATDSIDVELHDANSPYGIMSSVRSVLNQNGTAQCSFPSSLTGNYFIAIKHRNAVQTWSALPVSFATSPINYDFSNAATKAYGDNQFQVEPGVWALFSGDIVVDENMDLLDLGLLENDISNFAYGYLPSDLNGDGNVDLLDSAPMESNISIFIFSSHP